MPENANTIYFWTNDYYLEGVSGYKSLELNSANKDAIKIYGGAFNVKLPDGVMTLPEKSLAFDNETENYYITNTPACTNGAHNYEAQEFYINDEPTCTKIGTVYKRCSCGAFYVDTAHALGHDYSKIEIVTVATTASAGLKRYTCVREGCSVDDAGNPASYEELYTLDLDTSSATTTITVVASDGTIKEITLNVSDVFNITESGVAVTFAGVKDSIVISETESYTKTDIVKLTIPVGVTNVAANAFNGYTALEEVLVADGTVITFATGTFNDCPAFAKLTLGEGNYVFESKVFTSNCGTSAVLDAKKANVNFKASSFDSNTCIVDVLMSAGHTYTFGTKAFYGSALTQIVFPDNSTISFQRGKTQNIFQNSTSLEYIYLDSNIGVKSIDSEGAIFDGLTSLSKLVIMDLTYIENGTSAWAMRFREQLNSIVIANANTFTGSFFNAENKVNTSNALQVQINESGYTNFDCSINFGANFNGTLELIICAYVIDEDGNASFIQAENDYALEATIGSQLFTKVTLDLVVENVVNKQPDAILPSNDEE